MNREELVDKISDDIMSNVEGSGSVAGPDSPIIKVFGEIYAHIPKCVTDQIAFQEVLESMLGGTGAALCERLEDIVGENLHRGVHMTERELYALGKIVQLIIKFDRNV